MVELEERRRPLLLAAPGEQLDSDWPPLGIIHIKVNGVKKNYFLQKENVVFYNDKKGTFVLPL